MMNNDSKEIQNLTHLYNELAEAKKRVMAIQASGGDLKTYIEAKNKVIDLNKQINITVLGLQNFNKQPLKLNISELISNINNVSAIFSRAFNAISFGFNAVKSVVSPVIDSIKEFGTESFNAFNKSEVALNRLKLSLDSVGGRRIILI